MIKTVEPATPRRPSAIGEVGWGMMSSNDGMPKRIGSGKMFTKDVDNPGLHPHVFSTSLRT